jgi:hypothetical protein
MDWYAHIARAKPAMCDDSTLYAEMCAGFHEKTKYRRNMDDDMAFYG